MLTRILHPVTRAELYSFGTAAPTAKHITPTAVGLYGEHGTFERMMAALRRDPRIQDAGAFVICTQQIKRTPIGPVVHKTFAKYDV
jgi:hypothetical protein